MKKISCRFRPCIDLHHGEVKQIVGGSLRDDNAGLRTNFVAAEDSSYYAGLYRRDNLTGGHVICLGPGNDEAARRALAAWPGGLQLGGGVTPANARSWLDSGAAKVIVTSCVFKDGEIKLDVLEELTGITGPEHLVLDLSCRKIGDEYLVMTDRWQKATKFAVNERNCRFLASFASEFLIHAVANEGLRQGIDRELVELLAGVSPLPCTYAGGVADYNDIYLINEAGQGRIDYTVGSALDLFGGNLSYRKLLDEYNGK